MVGVLAGVLTTWVDFLPCFLWIEPIAPSMPSFLFQKPNSSSVPKVHSAVPSKMAVPLMPSTGIVQEMSGLAEMIGASAVISDSNHLSYPKQAKMMTIAVRSRW